MSIAKNSAVMVAIGILIGIGYFCDKFIIERLIAVKDHEQRIQALEQSQCSTKQDKVHADYKLQLCVNQLRSKP